MSVIVLGGKLEETLARVREQYVIVVSGCYTLAASLRTGAVDEGLHAVERICATLLITDELIGFMARAGGSGATLAEAHHLSQRMVRRAAPWIAAAVRDLPGAEVLVRMFVLAPPGARDPDELAPRGKGDGHA
jgi:hypothetical protein